MGRDMTHQRVGAISNTHAGREFEASARRFFADRGVDLGYNLKVPVGIGAQKKSHAFDLGCDAQKIIVECKSHRWTSTSNIPSAKLAVWNEAMYYFSLAPTGYKKVMFVLRDECAKRGLTLAEYYLKNYSHLVLSDVEFWEYDKAVQDAVCIRAAAGL
jgi:hypothetical protein